VRGTSRKARKEESKEEVSQEGTYRERSMHYGNYCDPNSTNEGGEGRKASSLDRESSDWEEFLVGPPRLV